MQNQNRAKGYGVLTAKAKRILAVVAVFIMTFSLSAAALADGGRAGGTQGGAPSGGQQTPGGMGGGQQQPANGNGTTQPGGAPNGEQSREAEGVNVDKITEAIAALEDETVQASLTTLLNTYVEALEAKQAAIAANETDGIDDLTAAVTAAKDALETALTEAGLSLDEILGTPELAGDGTGRMNGKPALDTTSIAASIAALDDTDENKATLETLLSAYEAALEAQSSADTTSLTEDEIAALQDAVVSAETQLREGLQSAGLTTEAAVQNQQQQKSQWQMTVVSDSGTTTGTAANSGLLTAIFNWLSTLFK